MRRDCDPVWVDPSGHRRVLTRVARRDREKYNEPFLQETLDECPDVLPAEEFAEDFAPLISLGREIETQAGYIDNLFISPTGKLTIVETKLWRNPQSTREAVAQTIDYAACVSHWSYEDLQKRCASALSGVSLYAFVGAARPDEPLSESEFHDAVQRNLEAGHFLLLVVGDGIRAGLARMLDYIQSRPMLHFTFGLVELQVFEVADSAGGFLVVPRVLAHSHEVPRTVFMREDEATGMTDMLVRPDDSGQQGPKRKPRRTLSEEEFYNEIASPRDREIARELVSRALSLGAVVQPKATSLMLKLEDPGGTRRLLTLFGVTTAGRLFWGWLPDQLREVESDPAIGSTWFDSIRRLVPATVKDDAPLDAVDPVMDDFFENLKEAIGAIRASVG